MIKIIAILLNLMIATCMAINRKLLRRNNPMYDFLLIVFILNLVTLTI